MKTLLEEKILTAIRDHRMLAPGDRLGIAVSGGTDSVALFHLLRGLQERLGVRLAVVHFDHQLRGSDSEADADFVCRLAQENGFELFLERKDVASAAKKHRWNLEDAARRLRYEFFRRLIRERLVSEIAVAHTADDQAETVLAHIFRGTGPAGLTGIHPVVDGIIRPLLGAEREDLREYLREIGRGWREDASNQDMSRQRARIRQQLVPILKRDFCAEIDSRLGNLAKLAREEQEFWDTLVEDRCSSLAQKDSEGMVIAIRDLLSPLKLAARSADKGDVQIQTHALTSRMIRRLYQKTRGPSESLGSVHVDQVLRLATGRAGNKRVQLPQQVCVERQFDQLRFARRPLASHTQETNRPLGPYQYPVTLADGGGETVVAVPELSSLFRLKVIDWPTPERDTKRVETALDANLIKHPVFLRSWRPGDAYRPRGRRHAKKIKELFLRARVPAGERRGWPVMESQGRIVWARRLPTVDRFCASPNTRLAVIISEERL